MNTLEEKLQGKNSSEKENILLNELFFSDINTIYNYPNSSYLKIYKTALNEEIINKSQILNALEYAILKKAKDDYEKILTNKSLQQIHITPSDLKIPECFGYAITKGTFSKEELSKIKFKYSEPLEDFVRKYGKISFPIRVYNKLFSEKKKYDKSNPKSTLF